VGTDDLGKGAKVRRQDGRGGALHDPEEPGLPGCKKAHKVHNLLRKVRTLAPGKTAIFQAVKREQDQ
jgi:hypothetical protein